MINGLIGVLIFSGTLPATRVAVAHFNPIFLTATRAAIAGLLAFSLLLLFKQRRPNAADVIPLGIVSLGVVIGFPLLTALALGYVTSAHSIVFTGLLPLATAIFGVLRDGERPALAFWLFSGLGSVLVASYALTQDMSASLIADGLMCAAVIICGLGYAEGAKLSRKLGGWQVVSWALLLSLPIMFPVALLSKPQSFGDISIPAWLGLAYISFFSMLLGFIFWYRGLAQGGIAAVSQLQLLQPFFGFVLAATLLDEPVNGHMIAITIGVVFCIIGARKFVR